MFPPWWGSVRGGRWESYFSSASTALASFSPQKQMSVLGKSITRTCPAPQSANRTTKPPAESIYTVSPRALLPLSGLTQGLTSSVCVGGVFPCLNFLIYKMDTAVLQTRYFCKGERRGGVWVPLLEHGAVRAQVGKDEETPFRRANYPLTQLASFFLFLLHKRHFVRSHKKRKGPGAAPHP